MQDGLVAVAVIVAAALAALVVATARTARAVTLQILGRYIAYRDYLDLEVEGLAGHRVVEVHLYGLLANLFDDTQHAVALCVAHGYLRAYEKDVLGQLAIYHKDCFRQIDDCIGDQFSITVFGFEGEGYALAGLFAFDSGLEFREQHARAEDKFQRLPGLRLVSDLSVNGEFVIHRNHFVCFYFHDNLLVN